MKTIKFNYQKNIVIFTISFFLNLNLVAMQNPDIQNNVTVLKESLLILKNKLLLLAQELTTVKKSLIKHPKKIAKPAELDAYSGAGQQWTFNTSEKQLNIISMFGAYAQIPGIGFYGAPYFHKKRLFLLEMTSDMLNNAPDIKEKIKDRAVFFYINILGALFADPWGKSEKIPTTTKNSTEFNIIFHSFLALYCDLNPKLQNPLAAPNYKNPKTKLPEDPKKPLNISTLCFNQNIKMGVFKYDGIKQAAKSPIALNALTDQSVHYHDAHFSPNNAYLGIEPGRQISTFWTIALSPDPKHIFKPENNQYKNHACVTYHLLINNEKLEAKIETILKENNFEKILQELTAINDIPEKDSLALKNFVETLNKLRS